MSYTDRFSAQWDTLVSNFRSEIGKLSAQDITLKKVKEWYRANSFCWSSIVETEGKLLNQQNNPELKHKLTSAIGDFRFEQVQSTVKKPTVWPYLCVSIVLAVIVCLILRLCFHIAFWIVILAAILCVMLPIVFFASKLDDYAKNAPKEISNLYAQQLIDYKQALLNICRQYE